MNNMKAKLVNKKHEIENAWTFSFKCNQLSSWVPGQFTRWVLPIKTDIKHDKEHWFTISSSPSNGVVSFTTRLSNSKFKSCLNSLQLGEEIEIDVPEGDFVWQEGTNNIFVAGGIGITPFMSMLRELDNSNKEIRAHLYYANRNESFIFRKELESLCKKHPGFLVSYIVGTLSIESLLLDVPNIADKKIYISGPEIMVDSISEQLKLKGVQDSQLIRDWFPGYDKATY